MKSLGKFFALMNKDTKTLGKSRLVFRFFNPDNEQTTIGIRESNYFLSQFVTRIVADFTVSLPGISSGIFWVIAIFNW